MADERRVFAPITNVYLNYNKNRYNVKKPVSNCKLGNKTIVPYLAVVERWLTFLRTSERERGRRESF